MSTIVLRAWPITPGDVEGRLATRARQADKGPAQRVHVAIGDVRALQERHPHPLAYVRFVEWCACRARKDKPHAARAGAVFAQVRGQPRRDRYGALPSLGLGRVEAK